MGYDYDKLYQETPNALGEPTDDFVHFFDNYDKQGARVLDIGCGQGRDAVFIARLGHDVTGVDMSAAGVKAVNNTAKSENLRLFAIVADIAEFSPSGTFDVIVIDRTLHMVPQEISHAVLARLIGHLAEGGYILIADERANMDGFRRILKASGHPWHCIKDTGTALFMMRS